MAPISADDLRELIKTRCWVEAIALRESIAARTPEWEEGLVLALHRLSRVPRSLNSESFATNPEWERLHRAFHIERADRACARSRGASDPRQGTATAARAGCSLFARV